jgi:hypothetical protein
MSHFPFDVYYPPSGQRCAGLELPVVLAHYDASPVFQNASGRFSHVTCFSLPVLDFTPTPLSFQQVEPGYVTQPLFLPSLRRERDVQLKKQHRELMARLDERELTVDSRDLVSRTASTMLRLQFLKFRFHVTQFPNGGNYFLVSKYRSLRVVEVGRGRYFEEGARCGSSHTNRILVTDIIPPSCLPTTNFSVAYVGSAEFSTYFVPPLEPNPSQSCPYFRLRIIQ